MRNYIVEFIGTFFLVLCIGLTGDPLAIGAMLMVMVYMGGHISGAHYNPAVSIAMLIRGILDLEDTIKYILSQLFGASIASLCVFWWSGSFMQVAPAETASMIQILAVEVIFTFALVLVILNVATNPKTEGNSYYGLAIGFTITAAAYSGGAISGGAYNPAVGIGPALIEFLIGDKVVFTNILYYIVGPILGGFLAVSLYKNITD